MTYKEAQAIIIDKLQQAGWTYHRYDRRSGRPLKNTYCIQENRIDRFKVWFMPRSIKAGGMTLAEARSTWLEKSQVMLLSKNSAEGISDYFEVYNR